MSAVWVSEDLISFSKLRQSDEIEASFLRLKGTIIVQIYFDTLHLFYNVQKIYSNKL